MTNRDPDQWQKILEPLIDDPVKAADRIIGDLIGYNHNSRYRKPDAAQIANALAAWARLASGDEFPTEGMR